VPDTNQDEKSKKVRSMFARIAHRYDLLNRMMTFGFDGSWRKEAVKRLELPSNATVLDLGTGTGDLAFELLSQHPDAHIVASDFTPEMIVVGKNRPRGGQVLWVIADAQSLPFSTGAFQGVVSGYLLRNVSDLDRALQEQARVVRNGGKMVSLDTTPPPPGFFRRFIEFHLRFIIPLLGKWVAGDADAYTYLPESTEKFLPAEVLAERICEAGFHPVHFSRRMLGTMAIHWGVRVIIDHL
jgi:demethylmenaquinone methyltransferase/2-methoxy-6-polyprenyl-1,4-benzoquinol methylase